MAMHRSNARNPATRDESKRFGLAGSVIAQRLVRQRIQRARAHIALDLAIPHIGIELGEPRAKLCQLPLRAGSGFSVPIVRLHSWEILRGAVHHSSNGLL